MKLFLLIVLGLVYAAPGQTVECPGSYHAVGNGCYTFPDVLVTWFDANSICGFSGGYLTQIDSAEEQSALKVYHDDSLSSTTPFRWIGASDSLYDGIWRWVPSGATVVYANWYPDEPLTGDTYNCAVWAIGNNRWRAFSCCDDTEYTAMPLCETVPL